MSSVGVSEILLLVTDNSSLRADSFANEVEVVFAHVIAERQENQCADGLGDEGIAEDFVFVVEECWRRVHREKAIGRSSEYECKQVAPRTNGNTLCVIRATGCGQLFELGQAVEELLVLDDARGEGGFQVFDYFGWGFAEEGFVG